MVLIKLVKQIPEEWEEYLELLLDVYKALNPDKIKSTIYGNSGNNNNSGSKGSGGKDPNAMEIDSANKGKGKGKQANSSEKEKRFCQICSGKGLKFKSKTHNTADCYDKPGNESKRPAPKASTSTPSSSKTPASKGTDKGGFKKKSYDLRARAMALLKEAEEADGRSSPDLVIGANTARIEEIPDTPELQVFRLPPSSTNEAGPSGAPPYVHPWARTRKEMSGYSPDFPKGL